MSVQFTADGDRSGFSAGFIHKCLHDPIRRDYKRIDTDNPDLCPEGIHCGTFRIIIAAAAIGVTVAINPHNSHDL